MFIPCHNVAMTTYYVEKMTMSCLPPAGHLFGTRQDCQCRIVLETIIGHNKKLLGEMNLRFVCIFRRQKWKK